MADWSIQLDSTELVNSTYNVSKVLDDTTADHENDLIETEGIDGAVVVSERFGTKTIEIRGTLVGSSPSDLQDKIDTLNELFSRLDKNLDITPPSGDTRRYVVRLEGAVEFDREFYHNDYVPFRARFLVPTGIGTATSETNAYSEANVTAERQPSSSSDTASFDGSAPPKPTFTITLDAVGKCDLITFTNDDDSTTMKLEVDDNFQNADVIEIDLEAETVKKNRSGTKTEIPFRGTLPSFELSSNNFHWDFQGATYVEDQTQTGNNRSENIGNTGAVTQVLTQSFIPSESGWLSRIKIWGNKVGTPGSLQVRVYTDNGGRPDQNLASASGFLEPESSFGSGAGSASEVTLDDSTPDYYLRAGVKYWLIFQTTDSSGNYYQINGTDSDNYTNGEALKYDGATNPPTDPLDWSEITGAGAIADFYFKTHQGQGGSADWQIDLDIDYTKRYR